MGQVWGGEQWNCTAWYLALLHVTTSEGGRPMSGAGA